MTGLVHPRMLAWAALWFLVVVIFTAGVGVITSATAAGQMPPLTHGVQSVVDDVPTGPSSAPSPGAVRAG